MFTTLCCSEDDDTLIVGVPADRCPIFYEVGQSHEVIGIGPDLMRIAAKEAGYNVDFRIIEEGYYFFKPMPVEQFEETAELNENAHRTSA